VVHGSEVVPLTDFQAWLGRLLAVNRSEDSHLAGAAGLLVAPNSLRYSHDLDYFHDSAERVASAYADDRETLLENECEIVEELGQPGYIRVSVRRGGSTTKIEWSHDSSWRFMPVIKSDEFGFQLHPVDLAINKVLALAGRDEPRDLLDVLFVHENELGLGALVWAGAGKDPGFTPRSLLELLRRRGKVRAEDLGRLDLVHPIDLTELKQQWLEALESTERFVRSRPPEEIGCLYYDPAQDRFVQPKPDDRVVAHFGRPGGVLPRAIG
jgi:hypothetical protein